jgi:hypothetical protein
MVTTARCNTQIAMLIKAIPVTGRGMFLMQKKREWAQI